MASNAKLALSIEVEVFVKGCGMDAVATQTIHAGLVSRVDDVFTDRVRDRVLVGVTLCAQLVAVVFEKKRPITAMGLVAGVASQVLAVSQVSPFLAALGPTWVVAIEADCSPLLLE